MIGAQFFNVLRAFHPMLGLDYHVPWPPGAPAPAPAPAPYRTGSCLIGTGITSKYSPRLVADGLTSVMLKGTDIGPLIPHVGPPSVTLVIEMLTSGSKSYFGPSYYQTVDQHQSPGNPAVALLGMVNPNLNCGTPLPTPTGTVLAFCTHTLGMTFGDLAGGIFNMAWDFAVQGVCYQLGLILFDDVTDKGILTKLVIRPVAARIASKLGIRVLSRAAARQAARALGRRSNIGPVAKELQKESADQLARFIDRSITGTSLVSGQALGSPLGPSISNYTPLSSGNDLLTQAAAGDSTPGDRVGTAVDDYLAQPNVEDVNHPSFQSPADAGVSDAGESLPGGVPQEPSAAADSAPDAGTDDLDAGAPTPTAADAGAPAPQPSAVQADAPDAGAHTPADASAATRASRTQPDAGAGAAAGPDAADGGAAKRQGTPASPAPRVVCDPDDPDAENGP